MRIIVSQERSSLVLFWSQSSVSLASKTMGGVKASWLKTTSSPVLVFHIFTVFFLHPVPFAVIFSRCVAPFRPNIRLDLVLKFRSQLLRISSKLGRSLWSCILACWTRYTLLDPSIDMDSPPGTPYKLTPCIPQNLYFVLQS